MRSYVAVLFWFHHRGFKGLWCCRALASQHCPRFWLLPRRTVWFWLRFRVVSLASSLFLLEWRLCKIMYKGKEMLREDMESCRINNPMSSKAEGSSSFINPMLLQQQLILAQPSYAFEPSSSMFLLTPSHDHVALQDNQHVSFPDLWF